MKVAVAILLTSNVLSVSVAAAMEIVVATMDSVSPVVKMMERIRNTRSHVKEETTIALAALFARPHEARRKRL